MIVEARQEACAIGSCLASLFQQGIAKWVMTRDEVVVTPLQTLQKTPIRYPRVFSIGPAVTARAGQHEVPYAIKKLIRKWLTEACQSPWQKVIDVRDDS